MQQKNVDLKIVMDGYSLTLLIILKCLLPIVPNHVDDKIITSLKISERKLQS